MYLHRSLEEKFIAANEMFPVLLLTGPRQVGKTTFLKHLSGSNRLYVTLDDPTNLHLAKTDPKLFLQRFPAPIIIDEIQYAPELLHIIKMQVDNHKIPGQFWLTGSQQFHMMKGVTESLAGRVGILNMLGVSYREYSKSANNLPFLPKNSYEVQYKSMNLQEVYQYIWRGSYPGIVLNDKMDRELFYSSYIQTYLRRDVSDLAKVGDEMTFLQFLRSAAARTGQMLNMVDMARDVGISPNTAKSWLSILQASGIIYLLEPYYTNLSKRMIKAPKLYFLDTGLCSYLSGWPNADVLEKSAMSGALLETFVVQEVIKSYINNGRQAPIFYYRDKDKNEIDLLIVENNIVYPIEIKKNSTPDKSAISSFRLLKKFSFEIGRGAVICLADRWMPIIENVNMLPVWMV